MTKNEIADALCNRFPEISKSTALLLVDGFSEILSQAFIAGNNSYLRGFGTFEVKHTKARKARNINAGTTIILPASRTVKFKPSKQLKNRMNHVTVD